MNTTATPRMTAWNTWVSESTAAVAGNDEAAYNAASAKWEQVAVSTTPNRTYVGPSVVELSFAVENKSNPAELNSTAAALAAKYGTTTTVTLKRRGRGYRQLVRFTSDNMSDIKALAKRHRKLTGK